MQMSGLQRSRLRNWWASRLRNWWAKQKLKRQDVSPRQREAFGNLETVSDLLIRLQRELIRREVNAELEAIAAKLRG